MRKFRFSKVRFPRLRGVGLARKGSRRFKFRRFSMAPMRMEAVPWTKGSSSHGWFKRRSGSLLKPFMKSMWSTYKRGRYGKSRRSGIAPYLPGMPSMIPVRPSLHLGLGAEDDLGLMRMSGGWLPAINLLGIGTMGLGLVAVYQVPKLPFMPEMLKTGVGRIGVQLGTGLVGNAILSKVVNRPDLGYHFFTGALAGTIIDALNTYLLKGAISLSGGTGMGVYVDRKPGNSTGVYVDRPQDMNDNGGDDDYDE